MENTKMSYEEYKDAVRKKLQESDWHYSEKMADWVIAHREIQLREDYEKEWILPIQPSILDFLAGRWAEVTDNLGKAECRSCFGGDCIMSFSSIGIKTDK